MRAARRTSGSARQQPQENEEPSANLLPPTRPSVNSNCGLCRVAAAGLLHLRRETPAARMDALGPRSHDPPLTAQGRDAGRTERLGSGLPTAVVPGGDSPRAIIGQAPRRGYIP
jgi:hypothetical protein